MNNNKKLHDNIYNNIFNLIRTLSNSKEVGITSDF